MAARVRGVRLSGGAAESATDAVALLSEYGRECAGAVVAVPVGTEPTANAEYVSIDDAALESRIAEVPLHPLGTDPRREIRMSLAGVQPKLLLARFDGSWYEAVGGAATTHILKPTTAWASSAENEALVLGLARAAGLTHVESWVETIGGTSVLVTQRYDRRIAGRAVTRLHQEDMCQALGIRPAEKYALGRPADRMARLVREFADSPRQELLTLFRQLAFRAIVGDEDGHGKNFSLLSDDGRISMAPVYDSLCTLAYDQLPGKMATPVGDRELLSQIDRDALLAEARAMRIPRPEARAALDNLASNLTAALAVAPVTDQVTERVVAIVGERVERLRTGRELGRP